MTPALVWFRQDLRLGDNPALSAAVARGGPVVAVYVLDDAAEGRWAPGAASRWWLHHALAALGAALAERGSRLVLARGGAPSELARLARALGAGAAYWNRRREPAAAAGERAAAAALAALGLEVRAFEAALLFEPGSVSNRQGLPFQVFTPFWRRCLELPVAEPLPAPRGRLRPPAAWPRSLALEDLGLLPAVRWDGGLAEAWQPGERAARARLRRFAAGALGAYAQGRDWPALEATSMLSAHLHFGEIGPRQVWSVVRALSRESGAFPPSDGARAFLAELGWGEFAHHLLVHFPGTPETPFRERFARFPWARDPGGLKLRAWCEGRTGYPIVDAGMRQLSRTGWMHNRVRMVTASFLVKHLRLPWTEGARWFWNTLVDADLANNTLGWQWSAGCGADAAPYFRIFSPVRQGLRWDPRGDYVRRWVPELAAMPDAFLHRPWEAPASVLASAGVRLGGTYPRPVVEHAAARRAALEAFRGLRAPGPA